MVTEREFDNITLEDIKVLRKFIDDHWQGEFTYRSSLKDLKPLVDCYMKLVDVEQAFDSD
jgi:hypothetical protein